MPKYDIFTRQVRPCKRAPGTTASWRYAGIAILPRNELAPLLHAMAREPGAQAQAFTHGRTIGRLVTETPPPKLGPHDTRRTEPC